MNDTLESKDRGDWLIIDKVKNGYILKVYTTSFANVYNYIYHKNELKDMLEKIEAILNGQKENADN
jgi:hypothetical protein